MVTCKAARRPGPDRGRRRWAGAVPAPARSVPASHCFRRSETGGQSWGGRPGFLEAGEGPSHSPDSPAHCHLSPSPGRCHTRRGKPCPEPHLQDGQGASLGGLVPWALVTSLHRPVCPTSQEPESPLAGEPVAVRGLCVSRPEKQRAPLTYALPRGLGAFRASRSGIAEGRLAGSSGTQCVP